MTTTSRAGARAEQASPQSSILDLTSAAGETVADAAEQVRSAAQEQYDTLAAAVKRNPLQAAGIAGGVGFVLAYLARR